MRKSKPVIIIGSGIGGLSMAIRLANQGFDVTIFEAAKQVGGKVNSLVYNQYRWDKGPSVFTLPHLLDQLFQDCDKHPSDYYQYEKLDIVTKYFYEDGTSFDAFSNPNRLAANFEEKFDEPKENVLQFLAKTKNMYDLTEDIFLNNSLRHFYRTTTLKDIKLLFRLHQLQSHLTMNSANKKTFKTLKAQQFFNRFATYNGSNPYKAPATINMIAHLEHNLGAYFLKGGMHQLTKSLEKLAIELGVKFQLNQAVDEILTDKNQAIGIRTSQGKFLSDIVVSNADVYQTYTKLLLNEKAPKRILKQEKSSSALIFYWAMNGRFPSLEMHNVFFAENYEGEFNKIDLGQIADDVTVYIYISSKKNEDDAPQNGENWFVMINTPHNQGQNWDELTAHTRKIVIEKLSENLNISIKNHIVYESILDPISIEKNTSSHKGALYGNSSNNLFAAFLRHPNNSSKIKNLYFVGGSVHPGGGVPLCLLSSKIALDLILYDQKNC